MSEIQARTGPAGNREIPDGPVGRWAGEPVASKTIIFTNGVLHEF